MGSVGVDTMSNTRDGVSKDDPVIQLSTDLLTLVPKGRGAEEYVADVAARLATAWDLMMARFSGGAPRLPVFRPWPKWLKQERPAGAGALMDLGGIPLDLVCHVNKSDFERWLSAQKGEKSTLPAGYTASRQGYVSPSGGLVQSLAVTRAGRVSDETLVALMRSRAYSYQREHGGSMADAVRSVRIDAADMGAEGAKPVSERTARAKTSEIRAILAPDTRPAESMAERVRRHAQEVLKAGTSTAYVDQPDWIKEAIDRGAWNARLGEARKRKNT